MNFYKYQTKLMLSACETPPFKCAECYRAFGSQADLQCHVYDQHGPRPPATDASAPGPPGSPADAAPRHEDKNASAANGDRDEAMTAGRTQAAIKVEPERDDDGDGGNEVNVKTERRDDVDGTEDEELIVDVGLNCGDRAAVVKTLLSSPPPPSSSSSRTPSPSPSSTSTRETADGNAR